MDNRPSNRYSFNYIIILFFILAIALFFSVLVDFAQSPFRMPTSTIQVINTFTSTPTKSPTITSTITLTPRPTWTLRPSSTSTDTPTPTATATSTLIPTLTPASPAKYNDRYELKPWDLSQQERTIELMQVNIILNPTVDSYRALAFAEGEAIKRFPGALSVTKWQWDRAYTLLHIKDTGGINLYALLIKEAVASGHIRVQDLSTWFSTNEKRLVLKAIAFPPQPGELSRELIEITGEEGSAYLWLVENPNNVSIDPLLNDIDFNQPHENSVIYADLTGDQSPELVIIRLTSPGSTSQIIPVFFDLSTTPPVSLPVQEQFPLQLGSEPRLEVSIETGTNGIKVLKTINTILSACPVHVTQIYEWNGSLFAVSKPEYSIEPVNGNEAYCAIDLDTASDSWGPDVAAYIATSMMEFWPPKLDIKGFPFPSDARDELRYRLGILLALSGKSEEAKKELNDLSSSPVVPDSRWVVPAKKFLVMYQKPEDLYMACQLVEQCNMGDALRMLVRLSGAKDTGQALAFLQQHGIATRSSGLFDFDLDGVKERWMIIRPKAEEKLEFWILSDTDNGVQAYFVQVFEASESLPFYHEPAGRVPVIQFELHRGFVFNHLPDTQEAYIHWVDVEYARPTMIKDGLFDAVNALITGANVSEVKSKLLELQASPRFKGDCIAFRICDQFHYALALVYDLAGEQSNAIDQYLWVWRNYGKSPYAIMARLKLDYFPLPTYTGSSVPSSTSTPTRTSTPSPTVTSSPTPTSTATPSPTSTPTP